MSDLLELVIEKDNYVVLDDLRWDFVQDQVLVRTLNLAKPQSNRKLWPARQKHPEMRAEGFGLREYVYQHPDVSLLITLVQRVNHYHD